jgi:hypothetical protein
MTETNEGYGDFLFFMGQYMDKGEYAVIFADTRSPYNLIKVVNLTNNDSNWEQTEFFEENWQKDIEGLVKVYAFTKFQVTKSLIRVIQNKVSDSIKNTNPIMQILDMDEGDEMSMWLMEKVAYVGLTHPDLSKEEMIDRVASAAYNIGIRTGYLLNDLKPQNYGFRNDGSAIIFDFNLEITDDNHWGGVPRIHLADYRKMITSAANTKV